MAQPTLENRNEALGTFPRTAVAGTLLCAALLSSCGPADQAAETASEADDSRISEFGRYEGYSEALYDGWENTSRYVEMRDGTRLAVDITFPAVDGERAEGRFPMVWTHSRYHRNPGALNKYFSPDDTTTINSMVDAGGDLQLLVKHGYVVAAVQVRGGGASFGAYQGLFSKAETDDGREMIEWFASQPWSDGNVGMFGGSYLGMTQYMAASEHPTALKAIFPNVAGLDMYDVLYPGGVYRSDMIDHWGGLTRNLDVEWLAPPVDSDEDSSLLRAAVADHADNWNVAVEYADGKFRDHNVPQHAWLDHGVSGVLEELNEAQVPAYHWNGWFDIFVLDATLFWANYEGPQRMGIGGWSHSGMPNEALMVEKGRLTAIEQHRWFDYWLKGIDNGIMDEDPINYALMVEPDEWTWESSASWPVAGARDVGFYFGEGQSGSIDSTNDGLLTSDAPSGEASFDSYQVDLTTTTGSATRWDNAVGGAPLMIYPDLTDNDRKALTYTSPVLEEDLTVTGHPVVTLWVTSSTNDGDFMVYLEEVDEEGVAHYVTEGVLRASHRQLDSAPWDNMGLPFQRSFEGDRTPLPEGEPAELKLDLHPTANVFNTGHRIRVTITGADADNMELQSVAPIYQVYRGGASASGIVLPVVQ